MIHGLDGEESDTGNYWKHVLLLKTKLNYIKLIHIASLTNY